MDIKQDQNQEIQESKEKKPPKEKKFSPELKAFKESLEKEPQLEKKIQDTLNFMREALSHGGSPRFRNFWDAKQIALDFFKENLNPLSRAHLWSDFTALLDEAQRLKEIFDEQASFAIEQIDLAINSIREELESYEQHLRQMPDIEFPEKCEAIESHVDTYNSTQKEIHLHNTLASRLNALRKEIIKTEMRIRHKNKLIEKISHLCDQILPKRKELIKSISELFFEDIKTFADSHFALTDQTLKEAEQKNLLYNLREEIKKLQNAAKLISINSFVFKETRKILSDCWEILKQEEKVKRKEFSEKKVLFKENLGKILEKLEPIEKAVADQTIQQEEFNRETQEILAFMKTVELGREEVYEVKAKIQDMRKTFYAKKHETTRLAKEKQEAKVAKRLESVAMLLKKIAEALEQADDLTTEALQEIKGKAYEELETLECTSSEQDQLDQLLHQVDFAIFEKRLREISEYTDEEMKLNELELLLESLEMLQDTIKESLENYRREAGGSNLDFESAMIYRELIDNQKSFFEQVENLIHRVDDQLSSFEE